ncbi:GerW family sporulation protein [Tumebacillus permanentifrigoris]|uniref:Sporulation protein YtfJ n=1 Tax=Tumebacillus permanentifrigoris TaxID=378543 RepID=A0A316DBR0_9BACL|nr:GerW family sporulation protein [Tumebacillus permanentifrigoris]PWK14440.1 sporulation protein YtfJ [Tumebacillus permanentifrigoris]
MAEHPIQGLMSTAMENLKEMVDVNTIIGDPVETPDGSVILPVSKVGFGFAAGGSEFDPEVEAGKKDHADVELPFGGGAGGGVSITPIGFLVVGNGQVKMLSTEGPNQMYEKLIELAPQMVDKISQMMNKNTKQQSGGGQIQGATGSSGGFMSKNKQAGNAQQQQQGDC